VFLSINHAQSPKIVFDRIAKEQGLIPGNVNDIIQDSVGFIWMATENGLCRYDGYNFIYYRHEVNDPASLSYNHVFSLLEDKRGTIWVGTLGGGLNRFDSRTGKFKRFTHNPNYDKSLSHDIIFKVYRDSRNRIWISTLGGGLNLFDPVRETFTHYKFLSKDSSSISSNMVSAIYEDKNKNMWFGTFDAGMNLFDEAKQKFIRFKQNPHDKNSISHNQIMDFLEDSYGRFWVATFGGGVNLFDRKARKFSSLKSTSNFPIKPDNLSIRKLFEDEESIWIATYSGMFKFDKKTFAKTSFYSNPNDEGTINDNKVRSIFKDRTGVMWFGTIAGANKFDSMKKKFQLIDFRQNYKSFLDNHYSIPQKFITDRILWAGPGKAVITKSYNRTINFFGDVDTKGGFYTKRSSNFYIDEKNYIWVGSYNGLHYYDMNNNEFSAVQYSDDGTPSQGNNFVKWFYIDKKNRFWTSTLAGGISIFDPEKKTLKRYVHHEPNPKSLGDSRVISVFEDSHGVFWISTFGGLDVYDEKEETFKHYIVLPNDSTCISNDRIYNIYESKAGDLWIGTYLGLNKYNRLKDNFEHYTTASGLSDNTIYSIQEDDEGNLWIRTNDGISKFDPVRKIFKNYSAKDGLPGMELNGNLFFKNRDGKMFVGYSNGLIAFYPKDVVDNPFKPQIAFTKLSIMDQEVKLGENSPLNKPLNETEEIVLSYKDKVISVEFAALHYAIPSKNKYAYKLEGFLDKWVFVDANNRVAKFTNLNPGKYVLKVTASNNDGIWSNIERSLVIIITPPYWETWWFRLIIILAFLGIVFLFYEMRLNKLIGIERTRSRIARNLHDEVGGTLSSIQYFVRAIEKELNGAASQETSKYLNLIMESSSDAQENIKDLIWTVNPDEDGLEKFLIKFNRYASDLLDSKGINYNIELPGENADKSISMDNRQHLWCICKEILTNIVRHSLCKNVKIKIHYDGKILELYFEDDGIGFSGTEKNMSNGIVNIRNRAVAMKARYNLTTGIDEGTKWSFSIKI
jgi:ligand-binding sensor domain-containing protein